MNSNMRYSSDPCRTTSDSDNARRFSGNNSRHPSSHDEPTSALPMPMGASNEDVFSTTPQHQHQQQQRIALDEDGYLEPKSASNSGGYLIVLQGNDVLINIFCGISNSIGSLTPFNFTLFQYLTPFNFTLFQYLKPINFTLFHYLTPFNFTLFQYLTPFNFTFSSV